LNPQTSHYLKEKIIEDDITDIISFHFALTPSAKTAIRKSGKKVNLSMVVTDPFTAPSAWFFVKGVKSYVFSEQVRNFAIEKCDYNPDDVEVMPFLINKKFLTKTTKDDVVALREKYGIPQDKRVVLIAGGGEGLPGTFKIISEFIAKKVDFSVIVVCGRGKKTRKTLEMLKKVNPKMNLFVFGFVTFLDELVKLSDCAIIKGGTSTVLEMLASNIPVILSTFIHGQELGNVRFVYENRAGWFIQKPKDISDKIAQLFSDDEYYQSVKTRTENLNLQTDCTEFVHKLMAQSNL
jgi:processive 1,2-diacylglycerol beta-glucosyltransferase/1,2-diacylglycerol 3-beta-galactosyltransferase